MADWLQLGIVLLAVSAATAYLSRRVAAFLRPRQAADCGGGCSGCPKSVARDPGAKSGPPLVQIDGFSSPDRTRA
ncbi:MAG TPA: FeoB-associated Cys-rich membrane protein [Pirellulaceae bacterium]|jgi:hypothetical protein|nr:FeoB-associated Cys-rich membrane protein [Pirellulaceae bacterium]